MNVTFDKALDKDLCESTIKSAISAYFESVGTDESELSHEAMLIQAHIAMAIYKKAASDGKPVPPLRYSDIELTNTMTRKLFKHLSKYVLELDFDKI